MGLYIYISDKDNNCIDSAKFCGFDDTMGIGERDLSHVKCDTCDYAPKSKSITCYECYDSDITYIITRGDLEELESAMDSNKGMIRRIMDDNNLDIVKITYDY